jgi:hypothetical protein
MNACAYTSRIAFRKAFPVAFRATLALTRKKGRVDLNLKGTTMLTLLFETTHDPNTLLVQLEDPEWLLDELDLKIPGAKPDSIQIPQTILSRDVFNLDECKGVLNPKTSEFTFTFALTLTLTRFPALASLGVRAPVRVTVFEKGKLDLKASILETHASSFRVSGGLMRALVVHPGEPDEMPALDFKNKVCHCDAGIGAHAIIGKVAPGQCAEEGAKRVLICAGTPVTLCWQSEGQNAANQSVSSASDPTILLGTSGAFVVGDKFLKPPTATTDYKFSAQGGTKCDGQFCIATDTVTIDVVSTGDTETLNAFNSGSGIWEVKVSPLTTDPKIMITSIRTVACALSNAIYPVWDCKKTDLNNHVTHGRVTTDSESPFAVPLVGTWQFVLADAGPNTYPVPRTSACFEVGVECGA